MKKNLKEAPNNKCNLMLLAITVLLGNFILCNPIAASTKVKSRATKTQTKEGFVKCTSVGTQKGNAKFGELPLDGSNQAYNGSVEYDLAFEDGTSALLEVSQTYRLEKTAKADEMKFITKFQIIEGGKAQTLLTKDIGRNCGVEKVDIQNGKILLHWICTSQVGDYGSAYEIRKVGPATYTLQERTAQSDEANLENDIKEVAHTLQLAAEDFKTTPGKEKMKPTSVRDLKDYIPTNIIKKTNPFNSKESYSPSGGALVDGYPKKPGQVGYIFNGQNHPYLIQGLGKESQVIIMLEEGK